MGSKRQMQLKPQYIQADYVRYVEIDPVVRAHSGLVRQADDPGDAPGSTNQRSSSGGSP